MNQRTPPARSLDVASSGEGQAESEPVALLVDDEGLRAQAKAALDATGYRVAGPEALESAPVLVVAESRDVVAAIADLRARARIDVAILVLSRGDQSIDAYRAGAHAVLRLPLVPPELASAVASAFGKASDRRPAVGPRMPDWNVPVHSPMIGRISAALSHELGNPLAVMSMNLEIVLDECERLTESERLLRDILDAPAEERAARIETARAHVATAPPPDEVFEALVDARASLDRMRALLSQIKELGGRPVRTVAAVDLAAATRAALAAAAEALAGIAVEEVVDRGAAGMGNATIVEAIVTHLVNNAAVAARQLTSPRVRVQLQSSGPSGEEAIITVQDNGPGIDPEIQEKVFEPFYTTRRGQGGVGLGLALCREYAQQIGARLTLWSLPGRGACFRLYLHRAK
jgi:signal transduction histidine kinase